LRKLAATGPADAELTFDESPASEFCTTASFGMKLAVMPFQNDSDAVAQHALCPLKLTASVYSRNTTAASEFAARLPVSSVTVNDAIAPTAHPGTPFAGRGRSGWGPTQGPEGLLEMTVPQTLSIRGGRFRPHVDAGLTAHPANGDVVRGMLQLSHGRGSVARFRGLWQMFGAMRRLGRPPE
jgi:hypothetical protein